MNYCITLVYHALLTGDRHLSLGNEQVRYFDEQVSPLFQENGKILSGSLTGCGFKGIWVNRNSTGYGLVWLVF